MQCNHCSHELSPNALFCNMCGTPTSETVTCRHCGHKNSKGAKFCSNCRGDLSESSVTQIPSNKPKSDDFIFAISEQVATAKAAAGASTPWGYFAVVIKDGFISTEASRELKAEIDSNKDQGNIWTRSWNAAKKWVGIGASNTTAAHTSNSEVYFVMDAQGLPLITHARPTPLTGYPEAQIKFEFWLEAPDKSTASNDPKNNPLGLFFQRCLGGRGSLTQYEFKQIAIEQAEKVLQNFNLDSLISDPASAQLISAELKKLTGISSNCFRVLGKVQERIQLDISRSPIKCTNIDEDKGSVCGQTFLKEMKFCTSCGGDLSTHDVKVQPKKLLSKEGEILTLRLSMMINRGAYAGVDPSLTTEIDVDNDFRFKVTEQVVDYLSSTLRDYTLAQLMQPSSLNEISNYLSDYLLKQFRGYITGFTVMDIRSASEEWFFQSEAAVKEELKRLQAEQSRLQVDNAEIDLDEAAFAVALRQLKQEQSQELRVRQVEMEQRLANANLELQEYEIDTQTELKKEAVDEQAERTRHERESSRMDRDRELQRKEKRFDREDESEAIDHDLSLDKKMAKHDIELTDMVGESQSRAKRRDISDNSFSEEERIRLQAKELQEVEAIRMEQELTKLKGLAAIDAELEKQKNEFEISKIQNLKGLSAQELLAMQAAELAKSAGGGEATANLIKAIADSQAAASGANIKDELYKEMLAVQKDAMQSAIQAHKDAANIAQSTNEKSMDVMSKVAEKAAGAVTTAVAVKLGDGNDKDKDKDNKVSKCSACGHTWASDKVIKFCEKCGEPQNKS